MPATIQDTDEVSPIPSLESVPEASLPEPSLGEVPAAPPLAPDLVLSPPTQGTFSRSNEDPRLREILDSGAYADEMLERFTEYQRELTIEYSGAKCSLRFLRLKDLTDIQNSIVHRAILQEEEIAIVEIIEDEQKYFEVICKKKKSQEFATFRCDAALTEELIKLDRVDNASTLLARSESTANIYKLIYDAVTSQEGCIKTWLGKACSLRLMNTEYVTCLENSILHSSILQGKEIAIVDITEKNQKQFKIICKKKKSLELINFDCDDELTKELIKLDLDENTSTLAHQESMGNIYNLVYNAVSLKEGHIQGKKVDFDACQQEVDAAETNCDQNGAELAKNKSTIEILREKRKLLRKRKSPRIPEETRTAIRALLREQLKFCHLTVLKHSRLTETLVQLLEEKSGLLNIVKREKEKLESYQRRLDIEINKIKMNQPAIASTAVQKKTALPSGTSAYEHELCEAWQIFTTIRPKRDKKPKENQQKFYNYSPLEILLLQHAIFEKDDWVGDLDQNLENKLTRALLARDKQVKGLGAAPRASIKQILGYDLLDEYKKKKKASEEQEKAKIKPTQKRKTIRQAKVILSDQDTDNENRDLQVTKKTKPTETAAVSLVPIDEQTETRSDILLTLKPGQREASAGQLQQGPTEGSQDNQTRKRLRPQEQDNLIEELKGKQESLAREKKARLEAETAAQREREEREKAEQQAQWEREERERIARLQAEQQVQREREERERTARLQAEQQAQREREERERIARLRAEQQAQREREERIKAEQQVQREREEKNRAEAELAKLQNMQNPPRRGPITPNTRAKIVSRRKAM